MRMREALFVGALGIVVLGLVPGAALPGEVGIRVSAAGGAYTNVWNLQGGMVAWRQRGLPLVKGARR